MDMFTGIIKAIIMGLIDSLRGTLAIFYLDKRIKEKMEQESPLKDGTPKRRSGGTSHSLKKKEEPKILWRAVQCCLLNGGVVWVSVVLFESLLLPIVCHILLAVTPDIGLWMWSYLETFLLYVFRATWVVPLFMLSKVINSLWFKDIADSAYRFSRGTPQQFSTFSKSVADFFFSLLVQTLFLAQTMLVGWLPVPWLGQGLSIVHMCLLYSLYSFEYKWCNMGWELHHRLTYIESNWPYFIGFGLPLVVCTEFFSSYVISGCVFSILFPLFIISGNEATPQTEVKCEIRLKLFSFVIFVSNAMFNRTIGAKSLSSAAR